MRTRIRKIKGGFTPQVAAPFLFFHIWGDLAEGDYAADYEPKPTAFTFRTEKEAQDYLCSRTFHHFEPCEDEDAVSFYRRCKHCAQVDWLDLITREWVEQDEADDNYPTALYLPNGIQLYH